MSNKQIPKSELDIVLFKFLQTIYHFEQREVSLFGISWDEIYLLHLLKRDPGMPVSEAARNLRVRDFVASRVITRLCREGLTRRENSQGDRRVVKVYITDPGLQKLDEIETYNYSVISKTLENIPELDVRTLMESIGRLGEFLGLEAWEKDS